MLYYGEIIIFLIKIFCDLFGFLKYFLYLCIVRKKILKLFLEIEYFLI